MRLLVFLLAGSLFVTPGFALPTKPEPYKKLGDWALNQGQTDCVIVVRKKETLIESCRPPYQPSNRHRLWSVSKSVLNLLVARAVKKNLIQLDVPASTYYPPLGQGRHAKIHVRHLLEMSSGLGFKEDYVNLLRSSVVPMLYGRGYTNMAQFVADFPVEDKPGEKYVYSSGSSNLLSKVLDLAIGERSLSDFAQKELFEPLQIQSATWETDASGTPVGSSFLYLSPRDLVRIGRFAIKELREPELLPDGWIKYSTSINTAMLKGKLKKGRVTPGAHWWTNAENTEKGFSKVWPDAPASTFASLGHQGQHLFVIPEHEIVAVRLAKDRKRRLFDRNQFLKEVLALP